MLATHPSRNGIAELPAKANLNAAQNAHHECRERLGKKIERSLHTSEQTGLTRSMLRAKLSHSPGLEDWRLPLGTIALEMIRTWVGPLVSLDSEDLPVVLLKTRRMATKRYAN
jgi:hypothetical protein